MTCAYEDRQTSGISEVILCHGMKFNQNYLYMVFYPGNSRAFWMHLQAPGACGWEQSSSSQLCQGDQAHCRTTMLPCRWRPLVPLCLTDTLRKHFSEIKLNTIPISHLLNPQPGYLILILLQGISLPMGKHLFWHLLEDFLEAVSSWRPHLNSPSWAATSRFRNTGRTIFLSLFQVCQSCSCKRMRRAEMPYIGFSQPVSISKDSI